MPEDSWPTEQELKDAGWVKARRNKVRINSAPRAKQYYWVDFPRDANAPEFVGEHPGVVIRGAKKLYSTCIIVPISSAGQLDLTYVHELSWNPNPDGRREGRTAYAICDHLYTVHTCRLRPVIENGRAIFARVTDEDFTAIRNLVLKALFPPGPASPPAAETAVPKAEFVK